jgi:hypothetical protein
VNREIIIVFAVVCIAAAVLAGGVQSALICVGTFIIGFLIARYIR